MPDQRTTRRHAPSVFHQMVHTFKAEIIPSLSKLFQSQVSGHGRVTAPPRPQHRNRHAACVCGALQLCSSSDIVIIIIIITIIITHFTDGLGDVEADILVSVFTLLHPVSLAHLNMNMQITADENITLDYLKLFLLLSSPDHPSRPR